MPTAKIVLAERDGTIRQNLTSLKWAWFDDTDPQNFTSPTDTGTTETTDTSGLIEVTLTGTSLTAGQEGCLAIMTNDNIDMGLYRVKLTQ